MKFSLKKENDTTTRTYKYNDNEKKLLVDLEYLSAIPKIIPITIEYKQIPVIPKSRYGKKGSCRRIHFSNLKAIIVFNQIP